MRTNMVSQIMEVEKLLFKGSCSKCNGVAYFSKIDGSPAFCPMCGEDAKDNWTQEKVVGMDEAGFTLQIRNDNPTLTVDFCVGEKEYSLLPYEQIEVEVKDQDCMYFDSIYEDDLGVE